MWMATSQPRTVVLTVFSRFMNALSTWMAEMATTDVISFCLRPPKSTLAIHSGLSCSPASMRDTKFS